MGAPLVKKAKRWDFSAGNIAKAGGSYLWGIASVVSPLPSAIDGVKTLVDFVKDPGKTWDREWGEKKQGLSDTWKAYKSGWSLLPGGNDAGVFWHNVTHFPWTGYIGVSWDNKDLAGVTGSAGVMVGTGLTVAVPLGIGSVRSVAGGALGSVARDAEIVVAAEVGAETSAANSAKGLLGRQYGVGTVVENPGLRIVGFSGASDPAHALNQVINRGLSPAVLRDTVANPTVVLKQGSGNYLYPTNDAAVVLRPDGQMVTAYGGADFRPHVLDILSEAAG